MKLVRVVVALSLLALGFVAFGGAAPASAAEQLSVRKIDTTKFPDVVISALYSGSKPTTSQVSVRENGRLISDLDVLPLAESSTPLGIVLVIDTSGSMKAGGRLDQAKVAAHAFVDRKLPNDQIAVVAFSNEPRVATNFTSDPALLDAAIDGLQPAGETALWDAVRDSANLLAARPDLLPYLVVLSDGADTVSRSTSTEAIATVLTAQAGVFAAAITGQGESDAPALRTLAERSGGSFAETSDARQLGRVYENLQRVLQSQYELRWTSTATTSPLAISVKIGATVVEASVPVNSIALGTESAPRVVAAPQTPQILAGSSGPVVISLLAALAVGFLAAGAMLLRKERPAIDDVLRAYSGRTGTEVAGADPVDRTLMPESIRRAVEATARLTGGGGALERLDGKLDQADLKLRAQEAVLFYSGGVVVATLLALLAAGPIIALSAFILIALAPIALLNSLAGRRQKAFTDQLPDALQLLASSLRAGYSLLQGFDSVAEEVEDPMGRELRRVVLETRLGRDMEASLEDLGTRMKSQDFDWVVMAIRIQREVGGNLAELLTSVAETMISRERLRREVSALTAEGRLSMYIVGALPLVIGAVIAVMNPGYLNTLFTTTIGKGMILGSVLLTVAGFAWMQKIIQIDV